MDHKEIIKRSVDSLQRIYAFIIALSINNAIQKSLANYHSFENLLPFVPSLLAFTVTVIPFYHGMNRHLDCIYIENGFKTKKEWVLLIDFFVFFMESFLLVAIALAVAPENRLSLIGFLIYLLVFDTVWAFISHLIHYKYLQQSIIKWSFINIFAVVCLLFLKCMSFSTTFQAWLLCIITVIRTALDYWLCFRFYFPVNQNITSRINS